LNSFLAQFLYKLLFTAFARLVKLEIRYNLSVVFYFYWQTLPAITYLSPFEWKHISNVDCDDEGPEWSVYHFSLSVNTTTTSQRKSVCLLTLIRKVRPDYYCAYKPVYTSHVALCTHVTWE